MSSYSKHIKKMTAILLKSSSISPDNIQDEKVLPMVKSSLKRKKKIISELSDIEKDQIAKVDDFHEFIEGHKIDDDSEE